MNESSTALLIGVLATGLGQIATITMFLIKARQQERREERLRQWEIEDRAQLAKKVVETSSALATTVRAHQRELTTAINENTAETVKAADAAHEAYKEANQVNNKIKDLNERLLTEQEKTNAIKQQSDAAIQENTTGIQKNTDEIAKNTAR